MPATKTHSLLIVDDEPDVLLSLTGLLRRDFQVHTATSGAEALEIIREHPIHVIMTDQRMPSMTGAELMSRVRTENPEAIRIIFTGYADTRAIVDAINSGELYRYITKPWDPDDLIQVLHEAAERHDEVAAQSALLGSLPDYLDDALQIATAAAGGSALDADFLQDFRARTERIRQHLRCIGASA